jgi:hypothetical protein
MHGAQVEKSGLITGTRLGAEREFDFDELEVRSIIAHLDSKSRAAQSIMLRGWRS